MESKVYTVACVGSLAREERLVKEAKRTAWVSGGIVGIILGIVLAAVTMGASNNAQPEEHQQMARKLEIPSATVLSMLETVEIAQPEQETLACVFTEKTHAWDVPLTDEELSTLLEACETGHISPAIGLGLIQVESSFRADALNPNSGCYGYCQLNPQYFPSGLSPVDNIRTGIEYLAYQLERYDGDLEAALTAYNAGHDTGSRTYSNMVLEVAAAFGG